MNTLPLLHRKELYAVSYIGLPTLHEKVQKLNEAYDLFHQQIVADEARVCLREHEDITTVLVVCQCEECEKARLQ